MTEPHNNDSNKRKDPPVSEDDDQESISDVDGEVYSEIQEELPHRPAFDQGLKMINETAKESLQQLRDILEQCSDVSPDLKNMIAKADEALSPRDPQRPMVGMVGATGTGKSSVLNAAIDTPFLSKELSAGESLTSVPTIFVNKLSWQTEKFAAEIRYYPSDKCRELLQEMLGNYNLYHFQFDEDWDQQQRHEYSQSADTAKQIFRTLFCEREDFESQRATEQTLEDSWKKDASSSLLNEMVLWCEECFENAELEENEEEGAGYTFLEARTVEDLLERVEPLVTPNYSYEEESLWPLVEYVRMGVPQSRVLEYVTIVDLPGITDTNRLRVNATHDHIRKCQALWYVAAVDRVCTDPDLERTISDYAERFPNTLAVIVTKIDVGISDGLAYDMKAKRQSVGDYFQTTEYINSLRNDLKTLRKRVKAPKLTPSAKNALRDEQEELVAIILAQESKRFEELVEVRSAYITGRLKKDKKKHLPADVELPIFHVSNRQYAVHKHSVHDEGPRLSMESTGIPSLRSYALSLAGPAIWQAHEDRLLHKTRVLFKGVFAWTQNRPSDRYDNLLTKVRDQCGLWDGLVEEGIQASIKTFREGMIQRMREGHAHSYKGAMKWFDTIVGRGWKHNSFLAFFRKDGRHRTCAIGAESWNERFIESQTKDVFNLHWDALISSPGNLLEAAVKKMITNIEDLPDFIALDPDSAPVAIGAFRDTLVAHTIGIHIAHNKRKTEYQQALANIKLDATLDQHTGHFTQAMEPCYTKGKEDSGTGVYRRLQDLLHDHLLQGDPLKTATDKLESALVRNAENHSWAVRDDVHKILATITQDFEFMIRRSDETDGETSARGKIAEFLQATMPGIDRIEHDLDEIKQKYPGL